MAEPALLDSARVLATVGRENEAISLLEQISSTASNGGRMGVYLQSRIRLAKILVGLGRGADALREVMDVLPLAEPEKYISAVLYR